MGRNEGKSKQIFIIINIILFIALLTLSYFQYQKYQNTVKEKEDIVKKYQEITNNKEIDDQKIKDINAKIDELNNIDEKIKATQQEVFKLASQLEQKIKKGETNVKIAYLTFDDGPYYNTYNVLKILKENKVKATFFTTNTNGEHCYDNKNANCHEVYKAIAKDNHTLANHTYTHGWNRGLYKNTESFMDAVRKQENLIKEKTGITTNILRFPGGSSTPGASRGKLMKQALYKAGYGWVDWTAGDGDGGYLKDYTTGWKNFTGTIGEKIEVVLFHDYHRVTTSMLPNVIKYLREKNYIILPLFYESVMINKG